MAFVPLSTAFLGSRVQLSTPKCCTITHSTRPSPRTWSMTATSPPSTNVDSEEASPLPFLPPTKRYPLKKGQSFNFVRFVSEPVAVDDFVPKPYFDGLTGKGVKVAVLDSGCDASHPALKNRIDTSLSKNYFAGSPQDWDDKDGHGTHVSGIILAEQNNGPMYGAAPEATLVVKKVLAPELRNFRGRLLSTNPIAEAIYDAVDEGCRVINMSLGSRIPRNSYFLREFVDEQYKACMYALSKGVVVVAAAGNSGRGFGGRANTITPPGAFGGVITVASHTDNNSRSDFSSRGGELDFMAAGEVISTYPLSKSNGYQDLIGTSMAAPLVSGLAALLVEAGDRAKISNFNGLNPNLVNDIRLTGFTGRNTFEFHEMLRNLAERPNEHNRETGYGRLVGAYEIVKGVIEQDF